MYQVTYFTVFVMSESQYREQKLGVVGIIVVIIAQIFPFNPQF